MSSIHLLFAVTVQPFKHLLLQFLCGICAVVLHLLCGASCLTYFILLQFVYAICLKGDGYTFRGGKYVLIISTISVKKASVLKEKYLLPMTTNLSHLELTLFQKSLDVQKTQHEVTKGVPLYKQAGNRQSITSPPKLKIIHIQMQSLRKHAYSNLLNILPPKRENFQIKKNLILFMFQLKT